MATNKKKITPADCDRWDTIPGILKMTNKPTAAQRKLAAEINAQREAAAKKSSGKKK